LIAADESFLVFCSKERGGFGGQDLFVSFRTPQGSWSIPKNMGETINTGADDMRPILSSEGKALFFTSDVSGVLNVYWVDSAYIDRLRP
jgi:Tol biopolymer transport system component